MTTPPLRLEDLAAWDRWAASVDRGEVTPREVADRTRDLVAMLRASFVRQVTEPAVPASGSGDDADLVDVHEAARILGQTRVGRVYEMKADKVFPEGTVVKLGQQLRFRRSRLQAWIDAGGTAEDHRGGARA